MSLEEAARRRDFTINAISLGPADRAATKIRSTAAPISSAGMLRAVDPQTFGDDSLRVLRAVQFAARFEFTLDDDTAALCRRDPARRPARRSASGARSRSCCCAPRGRRSASRSRSISASIDRLLPELRPLVGCEQEPEWHPEGDVWTHTLMVIDQARARNDDLDRPRLHHGDARRRLPRPRQAGDDRADRRPHPVARPRRGGRRADAARCSIGSTSTRIDGYDVRAQVVGLVAHHLKPGMFHKARHVGDGAFRRLAQKVDLELLARVARADCLGRTGSSTARRWTGSSNAPARSASSTSRPRRCSSGRHLLALGLAPGPRMGELLKQIYELQLDGAVRSLEDCIDAARVLLAREHP